jgi:hypothetical protein
LACLYKFLAGVTWNNYINCSEGGGASSLLSPTWGTVRIFKEKDLK